MFLSQLEFLSVISVRKGRRFVSNMPPPSTPPYWKTRRPRGRLCFTFTQKLGCQAHQCTMVYYRPWLAHMKDKTQSRMERKHNTGVTGRNMVEPILSYENRLQGAFFSDPCPKKRKESIRRLASFFGF